MTDNETIERVIAKTLEIIVSFFRAFYKAIIEIVWGIGAFMLVGVMLLTKPEVLSSSAALFFKLARFVSDYWQQWFIFFMIVYFLTYYFEGKK